MKSKWFGLKDEALALRRRGTSMTAIERQLGIPRSTLSNWFQSYALSAEQRAKLHQNSISGLRRARLAAAATHTRLKEARINAAKAEAILTLDKIPMTPAIFELALAMIYFGEGAKAGTTALGNSDPVIVRFFVHCLRTIYHVPVATIRCDLHLRADQDGERLKRYWADELSLPLSCFKYVAYDKRTAGKATYESYKGVCLVNCGDIAIQRKLVMLYTLFCNKIKSFDTGA